MQGTGSHRRVLGGVLLWVAAVALVTAQRRDVFVQPRDIAAIQYSTGQTDHVVTRVNRRLQDGTLRLAFNPDNGYLRSMLEALGLSVTSQMLVFSQTSQQAPLINMHNPRALFLGDEVAVAWVRGAERLEVAVLDPRQGGVFYTLDQKDGATPRLVRNNDCLACHLTWETLGVPGFLTTSMYPLPDDPNAYANGFTTIHGSPLEQRWGGWWVTGDHGGARHMGNVPVMPVDKGRARPNPRGVLKSVEGIFDLRGYPTSSSDVVALMVLNHQTQMMNHLTRTGWEARVAAALPSRDAESRVVEAAADLVAYMLLLDEAPLNAPVKGLSGYAEWFASQGPRDKQGRSLREFDLTRRLFKYACSYLVYSEAFDALPPPAKRAVYARLYDVLSGKVPSARGQRVLPPAERRAIIDILRDTKPDLPEFFR
ncbi:MAG TPA: hypothetical protein VIY56_19185 [Vicinamibacterales bacterium]